MQATTSRQICGTVPLFPLNNYNKISVCTRTCTALPFNGHSPLRVCLSFILFVSWFSLVLLLLLASSRAWPLYSLPFVILLWLSNAHTMHASFLVSAHSQRTFCFMLIVHSFFHETLFLSHEKGVHVHSHFCFFSLEKQLPLSFCLC